MNRLLVAIADTINYCIEHGLVEHLDFTNREGVPTVTYQSAMVLSAMIGIKVSRHSADSHLMTFSTRKVAMKAYKINTQKNEENISKGVMLMISKIYKDGKSE